MKDERARDLEALELKISHFLRWGVMAAGVILLIGWVWGFASAGAEPPFARFTDYRAVSLAQAVSACLASHNWPALITYLGLVVLISLPLLRVLMTAWLFFRSRDYVLAAVAAFVMIALIISISLGVEI